MEMTLAETFAGIGGWSEAARMAGGIRPVWRSEIDNYKNKVYDLRHPGVPNLGDICNIQQPPHADIYTVSFPCTDISSAGKGKGIEGPHSRLWFEALRVIGEGLPRYVIIENSPILTKRGLDRILGGLAGLGYDAEWTHLQGTQFGLQQLRKRLFLIAYPSEKRFIGIRKKSIFRSLSAGRGRAGAPLVFPGWSDRSSVPEPRTYRSANDIPSLIHRLECTGDAIIPLIGMYILECVKLHYNETTL